MIPQSKISKLSNRLFKETGGRKIPETVLERDYCIAWFLVGLSKTTLKNVLLFKGGTALRRCHYEDYRFSEDLDFTLLKHCSFEEIKIALEHVYQETKTASNVRFQFQRQDPQSHQNSYTFYLSFEGPLPKTSQPKEIKVDVTVSERIYFDPENKAVLKSCEEYSDLPDSSIIKVYSLLEIASEKTVALLDKARSEPRDLYDLWYLTENRKSVDLQDCIEAISAKLEHRNKTLVQVKDEFTNKEKRLRNTWNKRLDVQMNSVPEFEAVYRTVKRNLRQAGII